MGSCGLQIILIFGGIAIQKLKRYCVGFIKIKRERLAPFGTLKRIQMVNPPIINSKQQSIVGMSSDNAACPPKYNSLQSLQSYLSVIKTLNKDDLDDQYVELMESAKSLFGDVNPKMAKFYYEYGSYLLDKIEKNGEIFGSFKPTKDQKKAVEGIAEEDQDDEDSEKGDKEKERVEEQEQDGEERQHVCFKGEGVVIFEDDGTDRKPSPCDSATKQPAGSAEKKPQQQPQPQAQQDSDDDQDVCYQNLFASFSIYNDLYLKYLNGDQCLTDEQTKQLITYVAKVRCRLGDYHFIRENFEQAIQEFIEAGDILTKLPDSDTNSHIASVQLSIGNTYLTQGKPGCQQQSMPHFLKAVRTLVNKLIQLTGTNSYPVPDATLTAVQRLLYLPRWDDNQQVKRLKGIICEVLDKIQDTEIQRKEFKELQKVKEEQKKEHVVENSFTPLPQNANVVNLGTFGNANNLIRRKAPPAAEKKEEPDVQQETKRTKQ